MIYLLSHILRNGAERFADRPALIFRGRRMSYAGLEEESSRLAGVLVEQGVRRGDRVGIYLEKSPEAVISMWAILKAGAVYVPVDSQAPASRAAFMIADCSMRGLIGNATTLATLAPEALAEMHCCICAGDENQPGWIDWSEVRAAEPLSNPVEVSESDPAYILYTSGSTGSPKGVVISHRASLNFIQWAAREFSIKPADRLSNHAPLHFDLSVFDLFAGTWGGACVVLIPPELSVFPIHLCDLIHSERISVWYSVPSMLVRLLLYGQTERYALDHLRAVLFAGEVFPVKYLRLLRERLPAAELCNLYGPTETNVCTYHRVGEIPEQGDIPIGKACAGTEVFALGESGEPIRPGESGELLVGGPGLMSGYWKRPEASQSVLLPNPLAPPGAADRIYRTGDLVTVDEDGNFFFLGRRDEMVKSRGYRIELGEVEAVLHQAPEVLEAAVIAVPSEELGCELRALVVPFPDQTVDTGRLRRFCAERLPNYMIPSAFELRAALPRTSTGKVDKQKLAAHQG